jgi:hypothetical protein
VQEDTVDQLGAFHLELLKFLRLDIEKRCFDEGIDPKASPEAAFLLKDLDESFSFSEMIDGYQRTFGAKGPIHIEKLLLESIIAKDFVELGLGRYFPRVYRGLPRLYHRLQPSQSHIKKNFTHLSSLKRQAITKALFSLYGQLEVSGKVTLFTWVIPDGLGDYMAAFEVWRILRARLKNVEIHLVALVHKSVIDKLPCPEGSIFISYEGECPLSVIHDEALELLRSSDLILKMPTFYRYTADLMDVLEKMQSKHPMPKLEAVGEYGFIESGWFHPRSGGYSMGLHFLEKGILVRKAFLATWADVKNEKIQQLRLEGNHFYLAYLNTPIGGAIYLHALLKSLENDDKDIDLCTPDLAWFLKFVDQQKKEGLPLLKWDLGVSCIEIYFEEQMHVIPIQEKGKKIRVLAPGQISQSDFRALLSLSGDWVAVRGNQSFSEAISQGKAFFYDGRNHARYFMKDLCALAENRIPEYKTTLCCIRGMHQGFLHNLAPPEGDFVEETFFQSLEDWSKIALEIGLALQEPTTINGFKVLNNILVKEHSANSFFCHLVQRGLYHRKNPKMEKLEGDEVNLFTCQAQTFSQMIQSLRKLLSATFS